VGTLRDITSVTRMVNNLAPYFPSARIMSRSVSVPANGRCPSVL
jgi:hypothetical protein